MGFFTKLGRGLRVIGEKVAHGARVVGNKVGDVLLSAAPVAAAINPELGAAVAGVGGVAKGVGALGAVGEAALSGGKLNVGGARDAANQIRGEASRVKSAYREGAGRVRSALERSR